VTPHQKLRRISRVALADAIREPDLLTMSWRSCLLQNLAPILAGLGVILCTAAGAFGARADTIPVGPNAMHVSVDVPEAITTAARGDKAVLLRLEKIALPDGVSPVISIFAGLPNGATSASTEDPAFLGTISNVLRGETGARRIMPGGVVDATRAVRRLPAGAHRLDVTLVPAGPAAARAAARPLTIARASLVLGP